MVDPLISGAYTDDTLSVHIDLYRYPVRYIKVFKGGELVGKFHPISDFHLRNENGLPVKIVCVFADGDQHEAILMGGKKNRSSKRLYDFQPGDILVSCDNFGDFPPPGYMGHSALVLNERSIIEATTSMPQIRESSIREFTDIHPLFMQLRCLDRQCAYHAVEFAYQFLQIYQENLQAGEKIPEFSFNPKVTLDDPWNTIYCSKLVWLCYYYGAQMDLNNDFFLFSPEDLSTLEDDPRFEVVYKHPEFKFKLNT